MAGKHGRSGPPGNNNALQHGLYALQRRVKERGLRAIDGRSAVGRALSQWRSDLIRDLGGEASVSTQQSALVDLAVKSKLLLDSIDGWLLQQRSLVNARKRALLPVVRERTQLADSLAKYLTLLGLERRAKPLPTLQDLLAQGKDGDREPYGKAASDGESAPASS
jgi:hypothetical protein